MSTLSPSASFIPSAYQQAFFDFVSTGTGNAIVEAVAGSGKTTTLLQAMALMKGQVAYLVFNKKNADEAKGKTQGLAHVTTGTVHSFGFAALRKQVNARVDGSKVYNILKSRVDRMSYNEKSIYWTVSKMVLKLITLAKDAGVGIFSAIEDDASWMSLIKHHDLTSENGVGVSSYAFVISLCQSVLKESNSNLKVVDFSDMLYLPLLKDMPMAQYDWVLVDEAQDTNPVRRELAKRMLAPEGRFVGVGDSRQAVYGFTGADNDAMEILKVTFSAQTLPLSICYRCSLAAVKVAQTYVSHILPSDTAPEGSFTAQTYADFVKNALQMGLGGKDAIVCRKNAPLMATAFKLIRSGMGVRIEGKDIGTNLITICNKWKITDLNAFEAKLDQWSAAEVDKMEAAEQATKLEAFRDKVETLSTLIERAQETQIRTVAGLIDLIKSMFSDSDDQAHNLLTLSTVHKAKGLEWNRVFVLGLDQFMPSPMAKLPWQRAQEVNLKYVAVTRAKVDLVNLTEYPEKKRRREF